MITRSIRDWQGQAEDHSNVSDNLGQSGKGVMRVCRFVEQTDEVGAAEDLSLENLVILDQASSQL